jgi:hypothetical protein
MNYTKIASRVVKTISVASTSLFMYSATITDAHAGPAVSFMYDYLGLNHSECLQRSAYVLVESQLQSPSNGTNINQAPIVMGENSEITAIIDCSEVANEGRVTVMVGHSSNADIALDWAKTLLESMR